MSHTAKITGVQKMIDGASPIVSGEALRLTLPGSVGDLLHHSLTPHTYGTMTSAFNEHSASSGHSAYHTEFVKANTNVMERGRVTNCSSGSRSRFPDLTWPEGIQSNCSVPGQVRSGKRDRDPEEQFVTLPSFSMTPALALTNSVW